MSRTATVHFWMVVGRLQVGPPITLCVLQRPATREEGCLCLVAEWFLESPISYREQPLHISLIVSCRGRQPERTREGRSLSRIGLLREPPTKHKRPIWGQETIDVFWTQTDVINRLWRKVFWIFIQRKNRNQERREISFEGFLDAKWLVCSFYWSIFQRRTRKQERKSEPENRRKKIVPEMDGRRVSSLSVGSNESEGSGGTRVGEIFQKNWLPFFKEKNDSELVWYFL